jgi:hypothetical protein
MSHSHEASNLSTARELDQWQRRLAEQDQRLFDSLRPDGDGIAVGPHSYSFRPEDLRDADGLSLCESPPEGLAYITCRYVLEHIEDPWAYLHFWTRFLRLGGLLVLFVNPRHWDWIDSYAYWQLDEILAHLGFTPPFARRPMEHDFGYALIATKGRPTPTGTVFHSAAVEKDGAALLIDGPHGSGKTSLLLRLLGAGCRFLADSFTLLDTDLAARPGIPMMSLRPGIERYLPALADLLHQHPAGLDASGQFSERGIVHPDDWKHRFPAAEIPGVEFAEVGSARTVVFPEIGGDARPSLAEVSSAEAQRRLRSNRPRPYGHNLPQQRRTREQTITRLLETAGFFHLRLGEESPLPLLARIIGLDLP